MLEVHDVFLRLKSVCSLESIEVGIQSKKGTFTIKLSHRVGIRKGEGHPPRSSHESSSSSKLGDGDSERGT